MSEPNEASQIEISVSQKVLSRFVETVAEDAELSDVAQRLTEAIGKGAITEAALRAALFGEPEL